MLRLSAAGSIGALSVADIPAAVLAVSLGALIRHQFFSKNLLQPFLSAGVNSAAA
jgi:hypothetical protein